MPFVQLPNTCPIQVDGTRLHVVGDHPRLSRPHERQEEKARAHQDDAEECDAACDVDALHARASIGATFMKLGRAPAMMSMSAFERMALRKPCLA